MDVIKFEILKLIAKYKCKQMPSLSLKLIAITTYNFHTIQYS